MRKKKNIILMVFIGVLLIAVIAAVLVPKENTTVSWDCFSARFRLEQFLRAIEKGNYEKVHQHRTDRRYVPQPADCM